MTTPDTIRTWQVTTPAGTAIAAPLTTPLTFPQGIVTRASVRIPPGPNGVLGWRLLIGTNQAVPYKAGDWIVANDETIEWDLSLFPSTGAWQIQTYNTGQYNHTIYVQFDLAARILDTAQPVGETIPPSALSGAVPVSVTQIGNPDTTAFPTMPEGV